MVPKTGIDLQQVWFAGVHTDIGGGYLLAAWVMLPARGWPEAQACNLGLEPCCWLMNPDYMGPQPREYKGFTGHANMCVPLSRWFMRA